MLRRQKKDVETDLADKIEKVLRCELTPMQKAMYETILEGKVTMHNRVMQLRKIANVSSHTRAHTRRCKLRSLPHTIPRS